MIRVAVAGFGLGGRVFHAPLAASVEGLELAAIVERSGDKARSRYPDAAIYRSLEEVLRDGSIELVVITTPSGNHFEAAAQALRAGKHVVVDKPLAVSSEQISELAALAARSRRLLAPFHNRRWDGDFLTIRQILRENALGRMVHFESYFDRWRPVPKSGSWKEDPAQGGLLIDIGTHLADQSLLLFGKPLAVSADVARERDGEGSNDSFAVRLRYPGFMVTLSSNCLTAPGRPRFLLRGTKGNYWKWGLDPQEAELSQLARIPEGPWGQEPPSNWGALHLGVDGGVVTRPVKPQSGDYRLYYSAVRDAILGHGSLPVTAQEAWRVARLLEWAAESAVERREIECEWSGEPE